MKIQLAMTKDGSLLGQGAAFFEAYGTYQIPEDILRREGLAFLQRLAELHEREDDPTKAATS